MNDKEKKTADVLLEAINKAGNEDTRLRAVNAYREFMCAVEVRVRLPVIT